MVSEWKEEALGKVASLQRGHDLPAQERFHGPVPIMGSAGISGFHSKAKAKGPGIVIGRSGSSMGAVHFCATDYWPLNTALYVTDLHGNDPRFVYYLLTTLDFQQFNSGSAQKSLNRNQVHPYKVRLPTSLKEQKTIAEVLGCLDDKIESNHQLSASLEQIAQTIFKAWFVDFLPVLASAAARAEGRDPLRAAMCTLSGKDEAALDSMPREQYERLAVAAALFPDELVDSELGEVPRGWEVEPLGDVLDVLETGRRPKGGVGAYSDGIPSVGAENILGVGNYDFGKTKYIPTEFFDRMKSGIVEPYDVFLYKDGGKPGDFRPRVSLFGEGFPFQKFAINEHVFRMRSTRLGQPFLYYQLSSERVIFELAHRGAKAAIPGINQRDVNSVLFLAPSPAATSRFNEMVGDLLASMLVRANESHTLATIRDTLLPKLLSGEIRVGEAQELVEAAA